MTHNSIRNFIMSKICFNPFSFYLRFYGCYVASILCVEGATKKGSIFRGNFGVFILLLQRHNLPRGPSDNAKKYEGQQTLKGWESVGCGDGAEGLERERRNQKREERIGKVGKKNENKERKRDNCHKASQTWVKARSALCCWKGCDFAGREREREGKI